MPEVNVTAERQNPGISPNVSCSAMGRPAPEVKGINVSVELEGNTTHLQIVSSSHSSTGVDVAAIGAPLLLPGKDMKLKCCSKTIAGSDCGVTLLKPFGELPLDKVTT